MWFSFSLHYFSHFVVDERRDKIESMKTEKMDNLRVAPITKALDTREAWCTTTRTKITFNCMWKKRHFHKKGWAPEQALKKRLKVMGKWPFHKKGWAPEQALKKRLKVMGKWPISMVGTSYMIPIVPLTCGFLTGSHVWGSLSVQNTFAELMWEWPNTAGTWSCA